MSKYKRLPYEWYYFFIVVSTISGILVTAYLARAHYLNYTDTTYSSFCAISLAINCDTVAQSPWSIYLGLPVALWGLFGYSLFFILLLPLYKKTEEHLPVWLLLFVLSLTFSLISLFFAYISSYKINAFCILCATVYAINFSLLFQCWIVCRRFEIRIFRFNPTIIFSKYYYYIPLLTASSLLLISLLFLPRYWELKTPPLSAKIPYGMTDNGHPWLGAKDPVLTIEEFSDYQCFQCYKMQYTLRKIISENPGKIKLIHKHYPMDHQFNPIIVPTPFHIGSGKMALLAIYAADQENFWKMNDALFLLGRDKKPFNTKEIAKLTGIPNNELVLALSHPELRKRLNHDILTGMKNNIIATPSFLINDKIYTGFIPPEIINEAIR